MYTIAGRWEGALTTDDGGATTPFTLLQPSETADGSARAALSVSDSAPSPYRLLDGARTALVALADAVPDPVSGRLAQILVDARVRGDRLVGTWLRRDCNGTLLGSGSLSAIRTAPGV